MAPTVWEMNVVQTRIRPVNIIMVPHKLSSLSSITSAIASATTSSSPDVEMTFPRTKPPMANTTTLHKNWFKSSFDKIPVPKNSAKGMIPKTPILPKILVIWELAHQRRTVPTDTLTTKYCSRVSLSGAPERSRCKAHDTANESALGSWKQSTSHSQMSMLSTQHNGNDTKNLSQQNTEE